MNSDTLNDALVAKLLSPQMLQHYALLATVLIAGIAIQIVVKRVFPKRARRGRGARNDEERGRSDIHDPAAQLGAISQVDFEVQPLLNAEELPVLRLLEAEANGLDAGFRVMAQTSMGEILRPAPGSASADARQLAYRAINSKRLDFAVFDPDGSLVLAVEYQGSGHYHRTSFMRDAVKREVVRKAGVAFLEIPAVFDQAEIAGKVRGLLESHLRFPSGKRSPRMPVLVADPPLRVGRRPAPAPDIG